MAKDDYFVIMYMLLKRLYSLLKQGKVISNKELQELGYNYNTTYWEYILFNMSNEGYITGVTEVRALPGSTLRYENVQITPAGIEYLFSNSMMERVKNTLKDFKNMIPGA
ncbi:YjcQ family protein [Lactiplantibacillus plajomi]|uniref:YjcQ family protein n=1 Tax=Lactiplantibacillus plajomi TaxID=1457217 RepID=A0ABV6K495_9LACO|nr:YjcQ family protein [Lactiplantibacillus plajomi]